MRPVLRPGTHVLRRDRDELQVGLDPRHAVVLPDDSDTRASLALLSSSADVAEYDGSGTLDLLATNGLLLDGSTFLPLIPSCEVETSNPEPHRDDRTGRLETSRQDVAALARIAGDGAGDRLDARTRCRVDIATFTEAPDQPLAVTLVDLLRVAGVRTRRTPSRRSPGTPVPPSRPPSATADIVALVGVGEPQRDLIDEWMRAGTPHVLVRLTEGSATVGPFVVPGRTACLRCVDAHHTDADPCWPLLVAQYASLSRRNRPDGVPEPVDSILANLALAWAARDIASYAEGLRPSTWSATLRFDPHLTSIENRAWLRHPDCGCGWH
ncbi:MAG TPA: TOMM precursor leader peptide-binding protein [Nocardioidaceae bacterium]|nr:TOMM precursor leader peptide-binding protein [Nocardioidaceae bacterium]